MCPDAARAATSGFCMAPVCSVSGKLYRIWFWNLAAFEARLGTGIRYFAQRKKLTKTDHMDLKLNQTRLWNRVLHRHPLKEGSWRSYYQFVKWIDLQQLSWTPLNSNNQAKQSCPLTPPIFSSNHPIKLVIKSSKKSSKIELWLPKTKYQVVRVRIELGLGWFQTGAWKSHYSIRSMLNTNENVMILLFSLEPGNSFENRTRSSSQWHIQRIKFQNEHLWR